MNRTPGIPGDRHEQRSARRELRLPHEHVRLPSPCGEGRQGGVPAQLQGHAPRAGRHSGDGNSTLVHSIRFILNAISGQSGAGHRDGDSDQERVAQRQQQHRPDHRAPGRGVQAAAGGQGGEAVPQGAGLGRQQAAAAAEARAAAATAPRSGSGGMKAS